MQSIDDLFMKLNRSLGILENMIENNLIFFRLSFDIKPTFSFFICIKDDLSFTVWQTDIKVPSSKFSHITRSQHINRGLGISL